MASHLAEELVDNLVDACFYCEIDYKTDWEKEKQALLEYIEILEKQASE